ncbi:GAF domain-containing SpoIIE family protein phosphatase [candidate division KSB1 bacterium]
MDIDAIQQENQHLKRAVDELAFLNDLSRAIGASFNSGEIMQNIIRKSIRAINAEQGAICLVAEEEEAEMRTLVRSMVSHGSGRAFSLDQCFLGWMQLNKKPLNITNPQNDERFPGVKWDDTVRNVACVPLIVKSKLTGILSMFNKKGNSNFTDDDLRLLTIIAAQSAQIVENARLYEDEQAFLKLQEETRLARQIQINLLPKSAPEIPGYDIAGRSIPAMSVGGDYFDFIIIDSENYAICLGDISGKGMPAALLMSNLQATIRGQAIIGSMPKETICRSNTLLYRSTESNKFATLFYGILNLKDNKFLYTNAGHDPAIYLRGKSKTKLLKASGPVLGFLDNIEYSDETVAFNSGDICVLYSDGITEAMDSSENEFSLNRLEEVVKKNRTLSSCEIIDKILASVSEHSKNVPQSDDITVVVIKKL